jgi:hypothetical protein
MQNMKPGASALKHVKAEGGPQTQKVYKEVRNDE